VVEPRTPKDQLSEPIDERFVAHDGEALPVADEIVAELRARLCDPPVRRQLDEVPGLVLLELAGLDEAELHGCSVHALLEIDLIEAEPVSEELDDEVVAGEVIRLGHGA
jgi:hypothetical protein